jgi:hypothetical protein
LVISHGSKASEEEGISAVTAGRKQATNKSSDSDLVMVQPREQLGGFPIIAQCYEQEIL